MNMKLTRENVKQVADVLFGTYKATNALVPVEDIEQKEALARQRIGSALEMLLELSETDSRAANSVIAGLKWLYDPGRFESTYFTALNKLEEKSSSRVVDPSVLQTLPDPATLSPASRGGYDRG